MEHGDIPFSELVIARTAIYSAMRYGTAQPDAQICDLVDEVLEQSSSVAKPRFISDILPARLEGKAVVRVGDVDFRVGNIIGSYLEGMSDACLFIATAGVEFGEYVSEIRQSGDLLKEFVADSVGSVIAEACVDYLDRQLSASLGSPHSLPYSPGYCAWNIQEQKKLFSFFPPTPCGVKLSESCLMWPEKSVSGFFALGETLVPQPYRCEVCTNKNCYKHR